MPIIFTAQNQFAVEAQNAGGPGSILAAEADVDRAGNMGGGKLKGGTVIGASDEIGAMPKDRPTTPAEVAATIYKGLGIDLETELPGAQGRPIPVVDRGTEPIKELFA